MKSSLNKTFYETILENFMNFIEQFLPEKHTKWQSYSLNYNPGKKSIKLQLIRRGINLEKFLVKNNSSKALN